MKCDSCQFLIINPPEIDDPYGFYGCGKGHWEDYPTNLPKDFAEKDYPWKFCKDYKEDT